MAVKTCHEHGKRLKQFLRWLSKSELFDWKKPFDFDELRLDIQRSNRDKSSPVTARSRQVQTYTVVDLRTLNEYAVPVVRFLLPCGLNMGFKRMECATLRVGEVFLGELHPNAAYVDFEFQENDSFVRRLRTKTEVFAEWLLWPLTVEAMRRVLDRRKRQTHILDGDGRGRPIPFSSEALAFLNDSGHSFTKHTKSGKSSNQLTNA
jgi:hypothetical protein